MFSSSYSPPVPPEWDPHHGGHNGFWMTTFWQDEEFVVVLIHDKETLIEHDSELSIGYFPQGMGRQ